ncbi:DUF4835 family protein [Lacibacter luteus]|uniref:DUF4835 family protein n=1 Tax=Lacibacter luteus TaxID=2508719 RepID=A0A4Q1CPI7_9BACT|nr:DUF4835 family protein [Lacibacter luteus]RXK62814.1 DUF4835 family protein [Lacibacter luteus]
MFKKLLAAIICTCFVFCLQAQELNARVRVIDNQMPSTVDRKIFRTLETVLTNFLNNRKWSQDNFKSAEKINCQFLINLESMVEPNVYNASITIQAARPVYASSYVSPLINFKDASLDFKYVESQPVEFNDNRISGADPLASNLSAVMAYYAYIIIGFDYTSFSTRGGDPYFQKALNIVNNAPEASKISGWKSFESNNRNRYWLTENLINNRYATIHDVYYTYYRKGFDKLYEDEAAARLEVLNALLYLDNLNRETPNLMVVQFFMLGKADELINLFRKAPQQDKTRVVEILSRLDITNSNKYKQELK